MRKNYLFPHPCKKPGIVLSVVTGILLVLYYWGYDLFGKSFPDPVYLLCRAAGIDPSATVGILMALMAIFMLMAGFSKERDEDEYTAKLRGDSLILATVINYILLAVASVVLYDFEFLYFMCVALYLIMVLHIVFFNFMVARSRKKTLDE